MDIGMPWGVETLSREQRFAKAVNAGCDQLGGEEDVATLLSAIDSGLISESRIDEATYRMLVQKFEQGLFESPFVDTTTADELVGSKRARAAGRKAQRKSIICLKKPSSVNSSTRYYLENFSHSQADEVTSLNDADAAIIKLSTPHEDLHPNFFFGSRQQEGDIDFKPTLQVAKRIKALSKKVPTIAVIQMSRPAVVTDIINDLDGLYVDLGVSDDLMINAISSQIETEGTLPFELPRSMHAVRSQRPDYPSDSQDALFQVGADYKNNEGL
jgi:beta-glucosidase